MVKRRQLISFVGLGTAIAIVTGCFSRERDEAQAQNGLVKVGTRSTLKQKGELVANTAKGPVIVVAQGNGGALSAVNATCTHEGCRVKWQQAQQTFVCPCHGAQFSATGQKLAGPGKGNLPTYDVQVDGEAITVKL